MGTFNNNLLPASTGLNLGSPDQQWDLFANDLTIAGDATISGSISGNAKVLNTIRFADEFSGSTVPTQINNALADFTTGLCIVTPDMGTGDPTSFPSGKLILDLRDGMFEIDSTMTTDYVNNFRIEQGWNPSANSSLYQFGQTTELFTYAANTRTISGIPTAVYGSFNHFGSGAISSGYAGSFESFNAGSAAATLVVGINGSANNGGVAAGTPNQNPLNTGTATHLRGVVGIVKNLSSGTVTNASALYASTPVNSGGGTITNAYGLNVPDQAIGTNNWAIKTGLGTVEFGDNVLLDKGIGVGTALPDNAQSVLIQPNATLTGTTQIGIKTLPKTSAAATTFGVGTYSRADTLNASFTQTNNACFYAANPTKGASSTITNAFGLYIEDITNGGTKNRAIFTAGAAPSEFDGGVQVGASGTVVTQVKVYTPTLSPASVAANTTAEEIYSLTGLTTADTVYVNKPTSQAGLGIAGVRVSSADHIAINWINDTGSPIVPTASEVYRVVAIRS
jgi:hypothetical protein